MSLFLTAVGLVVGLDDVNAQGIRTTAAIAQSDAPVAKKGGLNAVISVNLDRAPLPQALRTIARQAGLTVTFGDRVHKDSRRVTLQRDGITVNEAFRNILEGTGLEYSVSQSGQVVIQSGTMEYKAQGVIAGKITDAKTGKGITAANVSINGQSGVSSGEDGGYRITGVTVGSHVLTVRLVGYAKQSRSVTVGEGATLTVDFKLEPSANVLDQVIVTGTVVRTELKAVPNAIAVITSKQIEERGITRIDQLFRGDIPGLFALSLGSGAPLDEVTMFSRGASAISTASVIPSNITNPIKTYVDGIELANPKYLSQIDPKSIERIEILTGPQASTIYGSNAINGVMQIFTKRGSTSRPHLTLDLLSGFVQNNFSSALTPQHDYSAQVSGLEGNLSYNAGGSWNYMGPWTPSKQLSRIGSFGGGRLEFTTPVGRMTADMTIRRTSTQSLQRGADAQTSNSLREDGWWGWDRFFGVGIAQPTTSTLNGQTFGFTLSYNPNSWWSHELGLGSDVTDSEQRVTANGYRFESDTTLLLSQAHTDRRSLRYATTARIPVTSLAQLTITAGADNWQGLTSSISASPQTLTGTLSNVTSISRRPGHNTGGFVQSQLGVKDQLFLTYGIRLERNPTIGENARVLPGRYGVAYTHEIGALTAKLRGSYGRSIRPPAATRKDASPVSDASFIAAYGNYEAFLANPDLAPEYQQGGEGGLELYLGTRGSLVITRYNQTVDQLIDLVTGIDSVRSLVPCPTTCSASSNFRDAEGYAFRYQSQYLNIGSLRNQGWETQSSINLGPFTARGTYSWVKSRVIGVTPKYRSFFANNPRYQPGATFRYLPEHTWAFGLTYARAGSSVGLNLMGIGSTFTDANKFFLEHLSSGIRLQQNRLNMDSNRYTNFNTPYAMADLNASHRFSSRVEALLYVQNLGDKYTADYLGAYATMGRQVKLGLRMRTN